MRTRYTTDPLPMSRTHYHLLDGLRGVAALMVVIYHIFESWAVSVESQWCNHGYLAVDFFFVLSGFVVGYAYDGRKATMGVGEFFKRRLIRLHPMVMLGVTLGAISFVATGCVNWSGEKVGFGWVVAAMLASFFLIPAAPGSRFDVRGNGELFSLNGPLWSLFCEYIGNILYALWLRRLSTRGLTAVVAISGISLGAYSMFNGSGHYHLGVGWTMSDGYLPAGLLAMTFCFSAGLLMSRLFRPMRIRGAFWICSAAIVVATAMPHLGGTENSWINGIYEAICILILFPSLVWIGASGRTTDSHSERICRFCGDISYPLYVVHYPLMYALYTVVWSNDLTMSQGLPLAAVTVLSSIVIAWAALHLYDAPLRRLLAARFLSHNG